MNASERVLVLAPWGRDGAVAGSLIERTGREALVVPSLPALLAAMTEGAGAAVVSDEALQGADLGALANWINRQPPWSDFPFVLLIKRPGDSENNPFLMQLQGMLSNVIFLERPFHPSGLISLIENALRGRRRQYETRAYLEDLREGERRLSMAMTAGRLGAWDLAIDTLTLNASDHCKANFGRGRHEPFTYSDLLASVAPEDRQRMQAAVALCISTGEDYAIEYRVIWPDKSQHWVDVRARVVRDAKGRSVSMVGVSSDVTARKRAETERERLLRELARERERTQAELRGEQALSSLLMTSVPAGIIAYDRDLSITVWNPQMERLVGVGSGHVVGRPLFEVIDKGQAESMESGVRDALRGKSSPVEEIEIGGSDGSPVWLESQHAPLMGGDGEVNGGVAFFRDITERRQAEEQLRQAQKMETIGQLTGGVAHDFNNLLAAVIGNLDLLRKKIPPDPALLRHIDGAMQGALRGASLTQRLLAFARRQDLKPIPTDLSKLIGGIEGLLERTLGTLITIETRLAPNLPPATVDPNQLELAILNLAVNARDAMMDGGTLTISLDQTAGEQSGLGLSGPFLRLCVADTGTGMDAETLKNAIEPFFSTKELGKGTGLGLSMVHGLAVQMGGALQLASSLGRGTVATLWLPVSQAPIKEIPHMEPEKTEAPASRILIVDDDALIAMNTVDMVEDLGHTVLEAYSGRQALEILESGEPIDALITDYAMPGMTGVELASRARALRPGLPILLATGYADLPSGTSTDLPRLAKPYQQRDLARQLAAILSK